MDVVGFTFRSGREERLPRNLPGTLTSVEHGREVIAQFSIDLEARVYTLQIPACYRATWSKLVHQQTVKDGRNFRQIVTDRYQCKLSTVNDTIQLRFEWRRRADDVADDAAMTEATLSDIKSAAHLVILELKKSVCSAYFNLRSATKQAEAALRAFEDIPAPERISVELDRALITRFAALTEGAIPDIIIEAYELVLHSLSKDYQYETLVRVWPYASDIVRGQFRTDKVTGAADIANVIYRSFVDMVTAAERESIPVWQVALQKHVEDKRTGSAEPTLGSAVEFAEGLFGAANELRIRGACSAMLAANIGKPGMGYRLEGNNIVRVQFASFQTLDNLSSMFYGLRCLTVHGNPHRTLTGDFWKLSYPGFTYTQFHIHRGRRRRPCGRLHGK